MVWFRLAALVAGGWVITWGFGLAGYHTPFTFAMALVGTTGLLTLWSLAWAVAAGDLRRAEQRGEGAG